MPSPVGPSMRLGVALVAILLLASGCIGKGGEGDADLVAAAETPLLDAPEGRGSIVAFEETNQTESGVGGVDHHHDLWNGQTRVVIFETAAMMEPAPGDTAIAEFQPPQGTFVFEGTGTIEFTLANPRRHASSRSSRSVATSTARTTSAKGSRRRRPWPTRARLTGFSCATSTPRPSSGSTAAHRLGRPDGPQDHPAHRDGHAACDLERLALSGREPARAGLHARSSTRRPRSCAQKATTSRSGRATRTSTRREARRALSSRTWRRRRAAGNAGLGSRARRRRGRARRALEAHQLRHEDALRLGEHHERDVPQPRDRAHAWFLYHRNATGENNITTVRDAETYSIDQREYLWVLPVDDGSMDSPYADGSRWEFELGASLTPPAGTSCYGGCADWYAEYTLHALASSELLAPEAYHMNCLDPDSYCGQEARRTMSRQGLSSPSAVVLSSMTARALLVTPSSSPPASRAA